VRGRLSVLYITAAAALALLVAGCGGGARQDANEPSGSYQLEVTHVSFPTKQAVARQTRFELQVHNTGSHTVPNVAVTVDSFNYTSNFAELAAGKRPIWVIEQGPGAIAKPPVESQEVSPPGGGQTAYVNTWALGALAAGKTQTFRWKVVPVKSGTYTVTYSIAAGLAGRSHAKLASGAPAKGHVTVAIASAPSTTHVDPKTGKVVPGAFPTTP
jgi:hypothetical protein